VVTIVRRGLFAGVLAALVLLPGIALAASKPIAQFHDHFTDSFATNLCGIDVDAVIVVSDNFFLYADGSFKDASSFRGTFTNPDNGKSVIVSSAGTVTGTASIDEGAGTITFVTSFKGLPEKIQTARGPVLVRDAGVITFADTFDLETGDFLGTEVTTVRGPHPEADSDFTLFCDTIVPALT
jgi:hypothetical protein